MSQPFDQQAPARGPLPRTLRFAVRCMYVGAGLEAIGAILSVVSIVRGTANPSSSAGAVIGFALWMWMARATRDGKRWARITGTVLFAIDSLILLGLLLAAHSLAHAATGAVTLTVVAGIVIWLAGLAATVLIWRPESGAYFQAAGGQ